MACLWHAWLKLILIVITVIIIIIMKKIKNKSKLQAKQTKIQKGKADCNEDIEIANYCNVA